MTDELKTVGNFMVYGNQGERVAGFATESDRDIFLAAQRLNDCKEGRTSMTNQTKVEVTCTRDTLLPTIEKLLLRFKIQNWRYNFDRVDGMVELVVHFPKEVANG